MWPHSLPQLCAPSISMSPTMIPPPMPVPSVKQHHAVVVGARPAPVFAIGRRIRVVGKSHRDAQMMAHPIADRKIPPTRQIPRPQDHPGVNVHWPGRRQAGPNHVVGHDARFRQQLRKQFAEPPASVFGALFLLGRHRVVRERPAREVDQPGLDIRSAHVDPDEARFLHCGS